MQIRSSAVDTPNRPAHKRQTHQSGAASKRQALTCDAEVSDQLFLSSAAAPQRSAEEQAKLNEWLIGAIASDNMDSVS